MNSQEQLWTRHLVMLTLVFNYDYAFEQRSSLGLVQVVDGDECIHTGRCEFHAPVSLKGLRFSQCFCTVGVCPRSS